MTRGILYSGDREEKAQGQRPQTMQTKHSLCSTAKQPGPSGRQGPRDATPDWRLWSRHRYVTVTMEREGAYEARHGGPMGGRAPSEHVGITPYCTQTSLEDRFFPRVGSRECGTRPSGVSCWQALSRESGPGGTVPKGPQGHGPANVRTLVGAQLSLTSLKCRPRGETLGPQGRVRARRKGWWAAALQSCPTLSSIQTPPQASRGH